MLSACSAGPSLHMKSHFRPPDPPISAWEHSEAGISRAVVPHRLHGWTLKAEQRCFPRSATAEAEKTAQAPFQTNQKRWNLPCRIDKSRREMKYRPATAAHIKECSRIVFKNQLNRNLGQAWLCFLCRNSSDSQSRILLTPVYSPKRRYLQKNCRRSFMEGIRKIQSGVFGEKNMLSSRIPDVEPPVGVSVIIPTLNAEKELNALLRALMLQEHPIEEILVVDSCSCDQTAAICRKYRKVRLITVQRREFDHGKTRDMAFRQSKGDVVIFLTQDAVPADSRFVGSLIAPLKDSLTAVSVGRQLPKQGASRAEALVRAFNYPDESRIRSEEDISALGIKAFFCSDSCAAYRRDAYFRIGGFLHPLRSNEDMFFAASALRRHYRIAYTAEACVFHSHNFTLKEQYRRNYIQGYEIEKHRELLGNASLNTEGLRMVKTVAGELLKTGSFLSLAGFGLDCAARWLGSRNGRAAYRREIKNARYR